MASTRLIMATVLLCAACGTATEAKPQLIGLGGGGEHGFFEVVFCQNHRRVDPELNHTLTVHRVGDFLPVALAQVESGEGRASGISRERARLRCG